MTALRVAMLLTNDFAHDARVFKEASSLVDRGCEVFVLAAAGRSLPDRESHGRIVVQRIPFGASRLLRTMIGVTLWPFRPLMRAMFREPTARNAAPRESRLPRLASFIAFNGDLVRSALPLRPDVVHAHDLDTLLAGAIVKRLTGARLVYDSHELFLERNIGAGSRWRSSLIWGFIERFCTRRTGGGAGGVDGFITVNQSIADHLNRQYPGLPKAVVVKNAPTFDSESGSEHRSYDGRLHKAAGLDAGAKILLYQGGFAMHRGLEALVRTVPLLPDPWCVVLMGWGQHGDSLRALARSIDPSEQRIWFIGPAPHAELAAWTAGATLGVICYENVCLNHWLCSPNKLWEYPAAGVPVLASPFPELRSVIEKHGIGRLLADPVTPENIAQTVRSIGSDDLRTMRGNCRSFLERDNWTMYEQRLVGAYEGLLGRTLDHRQTTTVPIQSRVRDGLLGVH